MIRLLRAFAALRWRLLLNSVRGSTRRDTWEQLSRLLALLVPAIIVFLSLTSIVAVSIGAFLGGVDLAGAHLVPPEIIIFVVRAVLVLATALVLFMPMGGAAHAGGTQYSRLLLLPIPRRILHLTEVIASLADPWILFLLPGLALFALGFMWGGRIDLGLMAGAGGIALAIVLASIAALATFSITWLFRDRRRAELMTIIFVMSISVIALLPQFLENRAAESARPEPAREDGRRTAAEMVAKVEGFLPVWTRALPSELFGAAMTSAVVRGDRGSGAVFVGALALEALVFYWLSGLVHGRLLESAGSASGGRQRVAALRPPWRLPGLTAPAGAVAWVMFRNSFRSVRGRVAVLLPGPMMAIVSLVLLRKPDETPWITALGTHSHLMFGVSLVVALLAINPFTHNQFASDRTGLTLQFLLPVSARDLVRGKAIGAGALFLMTLLICAIAASLATGGGSLAAWVTTALGGLATFIAVAPVATLLSALFPVAADMSKTGSGGNPHVVAGLVGMAAVGVAALPSLAIVVPGLVPGLTPSLGLLAMIAWLGVASAISWTLLSVVAGVVTARRENLFLTK